MLASAGSAPGLRSASQCECLLIVPAPHMTHLFVRRRLMSLAAATCAGAASATQAQPQKRVSVVLVCLLLLMNVPAAWAQADGEVNSPLRPTREEPALVKQFSD